jgi:ribosome maturation factor RimP
MRDEALAERIRALLLPTLEHLRYQLYDLKVGHHGNHTILQVFIDRPDGVSLDDCQRVSEAIGGLLDQADPVPSAYTLEVSSPGIDRPLRTPAEYERALSKKVNVRYRAGGGERIVEGRLMAVAPDAIELRLRDDAQVTIPLADVLSGRQAVEF